MISFWKDHNNLDVTLKVAKEDFDEWTGEGQLLYLIQSENGLLAFYILLVEVVILIGLNIYLF